MSLPAQVLRLASAVACGWFRFADKEVATRGLQSHAAAWATLVRPPPLSPVPSALLTACVPSVPAHCLLGYPLPEPSPASHGCRSSRGRRQERRWSF